MTLCGWVYANRIVMYSICMPKNYNLILTQKAVERLLIIDITLAQIHTALHSLIKRFRTDHDLVSLDLYTRGMLALHANFTAAYII